MDAERGVCVRLDVYVCILSMSGCVSGHVFRHFGVRVCACV